MLVARFNRKLQAARHCDHLAVLNILAGLVLGAILGGRGIVLRHCQSDGCVVYMEFDSNETSQDLEVARDCENPSFRENRVMITSSHVH